MSTSEDRSPQRRFHLGDGRITLASALLLCWPVLGIPPWRSEASWIDRLGRAVGWGWIVVTASVTALVCL